MKFVNDQNKSNGHSKIVANEVDKQCDNVTVGASFNTDEGMRRVACADNHSDNPYAELEFYLENVKVSNFSVFFSCVPRSPYRIAYNNNYATP